MKLTSLVVDGDVVDVWWWPLDLRWAETEAGESGIKPLSGGSAACSSHLAMSLLLVHIPAGDSGPILANLPPGSPFAWRSFGKPQVEAGPTYLLFIQGKAAGLD